MNPATATDDDATTTNPNESFLQRHPRLRRELLILAWSLGTGLILMPMLIYVVGLLTLGPYTSGGWWTLFLDLYRGLFRGWWAAWGVVLGPLALVGLIRGARFLYRRYLRSEPD
ncbi:MAG TPA: hypothetical protein VJ764_06535 [Steroidobacteraceae bacterium]|nr:hypothetical protein [Steroidobacteraceae bacterium]